MANYQSMIKGTLKALGNKAKQVAESNAVKDVYDRSTTTAKCYANIAKLTVLINGELEDQQKVFNEIGRLYYELNRENPAEDFQELFDKVSEMDEKIESMRQELSDAKAAVEASRANGGAEPTTEAKSDDANWEVEE